MFHGSMLRSRMRTVLLAIGYPYSPEPYSSPKRLIPQYQELEEYMKELEIHPVVATGELLEEPSCL